MQIDNEPGPRWSFIVTTVHDSRGRETKEHIRTHFDSFLTDNLEIINCTIDAAWTAVQEGRSDQGQLLLSEILPYEGLPWWLLSLGATVRPPTVSKV